VTAPLPIARNHGTELCLLPTIANRHGPITGATGTAKTVTLQAMVERFSRIGVPALVFKVADDNGLLPLDLKDLRAMLQHVRDHAQKLQTNHGNVSAAISASSAISASR
jgi:DNA helicase HerA-like ATPase